MVKLSTIMSDAATLSPAAALLGGGGLIGVYKLVQQAVDQKAYKKPLAIFSGSNQVLKPLIKLRNKGTKFDTVLDFCVWDEVSNRIIAETEYREILHKPASDFNGKHLPIYVIQEDGRLDSFTRLIVEVKDAKKLKYSHGGTGVTQVLLRGNFEVEVRTYSGPLTEVTLREA